MVAPFQSNLSDFSNSCDVPVIFSHVDRARMAFVTSITYESRQLTGVLVVGR